MLRAALFRTPKAGETLDDCQDSGAFNRATGLFAVADGATRSFFPGIWARLLTTGLARLSTDDLDAVFTTGAWEDWLSARRRKWHSALERIAARTENYIVSNRFKLRDPAAATLVALQILDDDPLWTWRALLCGDSCLFQIRDGELYQSHLIDDPDAFGDVPDLVASYGATGETRPVFVEGSGAAGDTFLLATDALAKWILTQRRLGGCAWTWCRDTLAGLESHQEFTDLIAGLRAADGQGRLANDDVCLIVVRLEPED